MTSKTDKFFTWVWRINGVVVLAIAFVCLVGLVALIVESGLFGGNNRPRDQLADVAGEDISADDLSLGGFRRLEGTDLLYATLATPAKFGGSGSGRGNARNWLFFDIESRKANWLFEDSANEIVDHQFLYRYSEDDADPDRTGDPIVTGIVMLVTNSDSEAENSRKARMILVSTDGKTIDVLTESVGGLFDYFYVSETSHLLLYSREGSVRIMDIDPVAARVLSDSVLSTDE